MLLVVAVVATIHAAHAFRATAFTTGDSASYIEPARHLACCGQFVGYDPIAYSAQTFFPRGPLRAETVRTPLYPLFMAAVFRLGGDLRAVVNAQHVIVALFSGLLFAFLARPLGRASAAIAAILYGAWPSVIDMAGVVMTEAIASVLLAIALGSFVIALRDHRVAIVVMSGLMFGVAALTRPITLYLPIVLAPLLFLVPQKRARLIAAFLISAALLPAAWAARNLERSGAAVVSSIEGENLLMYRGAGTLVVLEKSPLDAVFALQQQFGYHTKAMALRPVLAGQAIEAARRDGITDDKRTHAVLSRYYTRMGLRIIAEHPIAYAELALSSFIELFFNGLSVRAAQGGMNIIDATIRYVPVSIAIFVVAVFGVVSLLRHDRKLGLVVAITLIYCAIVSSGPEVCDRFLVPFFPVYAAATACGLVTIARNLARHRAV